MIIHFNKTNQIVDQSNLYQVYK